MLNAVRNMGKKVRIVLDVTELGRAGGRARAANMSAAERSASACAAAQARWAKVKKEKRGARREPRRDQLAVVSGDQRPDFFTVGNISGIGGRIQRCAQIMRHRRRCGESRQLDQPYCPLIVPGVSSPDQLPQRRLRQSPCKQLFGSWFILRSDGPSGPREPRPFFSTGLPWPTGSSRPGHERATAPLCGPLVAHSNIPSGPEKEGCKSLRGREYRRVVARVAHAAQRLNRR